MVEIEESECPWENNDHSRKEIGLTPGKEHIQDKWHLSE
jgi:hypothetical protein